MGEIVIGPQSGMNWFPLSETDIPCPRTKSTVDSVRTWAESYLTDHVPELGREGPVCPYVRPSLRRDLMWVGRVPGVRPWPSYVRLVIEDALELFGRLAPTEGGGSALRAIVTALPDLRDFSLIDRLHDELKSRFVERGFMLGQFYPGCKEPGLWNKDFHPLDTPIPMLVVRSMMATDFPFLLGRPEWMAAYVKKFAPTLPAHVRHVMVSRLTASSDTDVPAYEFQDEPETNGAPSTRKNATPISATTRRAG
ncbi:DUF6875 domain-containing protein [Nocardia bhagyanarayanae]|uniref:DUF6875 domain-containing protein n=1 Tax=Nocardia bhagyanarayanae TaxID=1215925 RepID=A0A543F3X1_9NOCA|nr:hypothetical protein [Nocardia bhagyanarayanae]TQM28529.1 hypothetical protein FB390_0099 [Nocardia bhagyanarayanae]